MSYPREGIAARVAVAKARLESVGLQPTRLYLGNEEWEELREMAEAYMGFRLDKNAAGSRRPEFQGMKLFSVDEDTHLGVGE